MEERKMIGARLQITEYEKVKELADEYEITVSDLIKVALQYFEKKRPTVHKLVVET